jgi:hypothetical protein
MARPDYVSPTIVRRALALLCLLLALAIGAIIIGPSLARAATRAKLFDLTQTVLSTVDGR